MDSDPQASKRPAPKFKKFLRIVTLALVVFYVLIWTRIRYLQSRAAQSVVVRFKSEAELSKIPVSADSYPCLLIGRIGANPDEPLKASLGQCSPALHNDDDIEQYEVDLRSGLFVLRKTDLFIRDSMPLALTREYHLGDQHSRGFGIGCNHAYDIFPVGDRFPYTYMDLILGDGASVHYNRISEGSSYVDFVNEHRGTPATVFEKSQIRWNADHWDLTFQDGRLYSFPEAYHARRPVDGALVGMRSPNGEKIKVVRDAKHNLMSLASPHGHQIRFTYDDADRVTQAGMLFADICIRRGERRRFKI